MYLRRAGEDVVAVFSEGVEFVFAGVDFDGGDEGGAAADVGDDAAVLGDAAGEEDDVDAAVHGGREGGDVFRDVQAEGVEPGVHFGVSGGGPALQFAEVVRAEERDGAALTEDSAFDFLLGHAAAEAHFNERESRAGAGAFRCEGAVAAQAVVRVDHLSIPVQGDGDSTAHMGYDGGYVVPDATVVIEVLAHGGAGIQSMQECAAREFGETAHAAFRQHFVGHRRVGDEGAAARGHDAHRLAVGVDHAGDVVGDDGGEVAGVDAVAAGEEDLPHVGIDLIDSGDHRGEQAAAGHDDVDPVQADAFLVQESGHGVTPHPVLVQHVGIPACFFSRMLERAGAHRLTVHIVSDLGRCRPCVDDEYFPFHLTQSLVLSQS